MSKKKGTVTMHQDPKLGELIKQIEKKLTEEEFNAIGVFAARAIQLRSNYEELSAELLKTQKQIRELECGIATTGNFLAILISRAGGELRFAKDESISNDDERQRLVVNCDIDAATGSSILTVGGSESNP